VQVHAAGRPPAVVAAADSAVAAAFVGRRSADRLVGGGGPGLLLSVGKGFARQRLQGAAPAQAACAPTPVRSFIHLVYQWPAHRPNDYKDTKP
jgi:hypothetical protein